jgi:hypothetical protein
MTGFDRFRAEKMSSFVKSLVATRSAGIQRGIQGFRALRAGYQGQ